MKFIYQYRTPDNKQHRGVVRAASKDAAYATLKAQGIKPGRVEEAPGFFNKLFGKGKRWLAIAALAIVAAVAVAVAEKSRRTVENERTEQMFEERAQLYGDPVVIGECEACGWTNVFATAFDCILAQYAIPGRTVAKSVVHDSVGGGDDLTAPIEIAESDLREIAQMKRMVNGMKRELAEYLKDGGSVRGYLKRLDIRQRAERGIFETIQRELLRTKNPGEWKTKNAELRDRGLPMVENPADDPLRKK